MREGLYSYTLLSWPRKNLYSSYIIPNIVKITTRKMLSVQTFSMIDVKLEWRGNRTNNLSSDLRWGLNLKPLHSSITLSKWVKNLYFLIAKIMVFWKMRAFPPWNKPFLLWLFRLHSQRPDLVVRSDLYLVTSGRFSSYVFVPYNNTRCGFVALLITYALLIRIRATNENYNLPPVIGWIMREETEAYLELRGTVLV